MACSALTKLSTVLNATRLSWCAVQKTRKQFIIYDITFVKKKDLTKPRDDSIEVRRVEDPDLPVPMENPYEKPLPQCILCKFNIIPDYKNVRLLSQFVSPYTGRIYGRHITGLCEHKQKKVELEISKSRASGLMAYYFKDPVYFKDPKLYDPENPLRPHKY